MAGIDNQQNLYGDAGSATVSSSAFNGLVVGVMEDPAFAGQEVGREK